MSNEVVSLSARYPVRKVKKLARLARDNHRSLAAEIRVALDAHLDFHESEHAPFLKKDWKLHDDAHLKGERP